MEIAKKLFEITKDIYIDAELSLKKGRITIGCAGYNQMTIHTRAGNRTLIRFRFGDKKEEIQTLLDTSNMPYTERTHHFNVILNKIELEENTEIFQKIAELNNRWWE